MTTDERAAPDLAARLRASVSDLDVTDNAPFAALWALRSTGALPPAEDLDRELIEWRDWIEEDYYDGEPLDLPAITRRDS